MVLTRRKPAYVSAAIALVVALVITLITPSFAATTCQIPSQSREALSLLPAETPNQELFNLAVLVRVNFERCAEGLPPLESHSGLNAVAATHATWMARARKLSHKSTIRGQSNVQERVRRALASPRTGAENIGYVHRYRVDEDKVFYRRSGPCKFATRQGQTIPAHTYSSLADRIVKLWMDSPSHRVNVMNQDVTYSATAVAFDAKAKHCGVFYMSQEFAG